MPENSNPALGNRIAALDITRGIAVLGILLMNIVGWGLPFAYEDPTNAGGATGSDLWAWRISVLFVEGTMRGLFTILFGASALLFLQRVDARNPGASSKYYFRRMLWLIVFGLINGYVLLWDGDILFYYGVVGCFLFLFRNYNARTLLIASAITLVLQFSVTAYEYVSYQELSARAREAQLAEAQGRALTADQREWLGRYEEKQEDFKPSPSQMQSAIDYMRTSYRSAFEYIYARTFYVHTVFFVKHGFGDSLAMMLIGMALLRLRILTADASPGLYQKMVVVGYAIGLPVNLFEINQIERASFSVDAFMASYLTYDVGRVAVTMGHLGLILLFCQSQMMQRIKLALAAVGKMALTNYLLQSVICLFVFSGAGMALYGQLNRHELYYVVVAVWLAQLWWSPVWLGRFRHGPTEWLWRKLTYYERRSDVVTK